MIYKMIFQTSNLNWYEKEFNYRIHCHIHSYQSCCMSIPNFCLSIPFVYKSPIPYNKLEKDNPNRYCKN